MCSLVILDFWNTAYPVDAPFGLKGWHVAFMVVGFPGIFMAAWVRTLREPVRGISEGLVAEKHPAPFKVLATELAAMLPPLNLVGLVRYKASLCDRGRRNRIGLLGAHPGDGQCGPMDCLGLGRLCDLLVGPVTEGSRPRHVWNDVSLKSLRLHSSA